MYENKEQEEKGVIRLGYSNSSGRVRKDTGIFKISADKNARP
jgi:hypothetical protein